MSFEWRPQRGALADAMAEKREFASFAEMVAFLQQDWSSFGAEVVNVKAEPYGHDARINWDTYLVTGELLHRDGSEKAVFGYTNGNPLDERSEQPQT